MGDTGEPPAAIRPRIQRLLLSDEYYEFEELVLVEAAFAQVTRRGRGLRQVQIAVTPTKFIIATDELGGEDADSLFYLAPDDVDSDADWDTLEMVSIVPIECVNLSVFSRRRHKLKARFCNGKVYYFELSERGSLGGRAADSVWRQWEERVEFLCPNLNSSSSETSVANTSSTLSTLERRRSLRQLAAAGRGQVQVSWFARGGQVASGVGSQSQRADSSVWLTSEEQDVKPTRPEPVKPQPPAPVVPPLPAVSATTDSSASTCSTCGSTSTSSETSSGTSATTTATTTRTTRTARTSVRTPAGTGGARGQTPPPPTTPAGTLERRKSQTLMINRFGTGVEEKCTLSLYLSSDVSLELSAADRQRLSAFTKVADDALQLWELSALSRKRRHTRHSVLAPLAERQLGWTLLSPTGRHMARVRRAASETRLGPVAVRRRVCGQARGAEFHLPLRRGDLCATASVEDLSTIPSAGRESVSTEGRAVFWRPEQTERPVLARAVYTRRLELLKEFRVAHEKLRAAETRRSKEKQSKVARSLSKLSARAKQSATSQAIKSTYKQLFRSFSGTSRPGKKRDSEDAGRRTASEGRVGSSQQSVGRQRSVSLSPMQRQRRGDNGDSTAIGSGAAGTSGGGSLAFCRFMSPRRGGSPEPDVVSLSQRSETCSLASDGAITLSEALSLEPSLLDSVSGTTAPHGLGGGAGARSDSTAATMPGCTTLRRVREIDSAVLAHQMTLIDREMLRRVSAAQLMALLTRPDPRLLEPLVTAMLFFHRIVCLVTTNVLLEETSRDRAKVITKLVTVAERCYHLRNFHSCKAVLSGLQTVPVFRLRQTWEHMKTRHDRKYRAFKSLSKLFADTRLPPYQRVAADVAASGQAFVPFLGDVLALVLGHNRPPAAGAIRRPEDAPPGSPVLSWVRQHFDPPPEEVAARRRVLQRKYVTRWRAAVRCRRLSARRYRPSWLQGPVGRAGGGGVGAWPHEAPARRRLRHRLAEDCAAVAAPAAAAVRVSRLWARWRRSVETYRLEERPLVREYLLLARHYTMETALGLSLDREPPDGSSCTLCSNTGVVTDTSADPVSQTG
ncbi:uncharacterized protein LOC122376448 [Amphibalanus amphitrite]|uniref:uncharacterized protein LOC122376448 n=1 Tax=Amphibalanus amphitrite TaxID=1232801 RepID=UPI001C91833E|nr:uncharacterized protein LOC122376448 [Amphibalanus amphitrite]